MQSLRYINACMRAVIKKIQSNIMNIQSKRRITATLTLIPTAICGKGSTFLTKGHYRGILEVNGYSYEADDGNSVGLAAYVMNVGTLNIISPSYPDGVLKMMASRANFPASIQRLCECRIAKQHGESWFLKRAWTAMKVSHDSKRQPRNFVDWWNSELLPPVVARIPVERRVNVRLHSGSFEDDGISMTHPHRVRVVSSQIRLGAQRS